MNKIEEEIENKIRNLIMYYKEKNLKVDNNFLDELFTILDSENKYKYKILLSNEQNDRIKAQCDTTKEKITFFSKNIEDYINNFEDASEVFDLLYYTFILIHEYEHINQYNKKQDEYFNCVFNYLRVIKRMNKNKEIYIEHHDEFISEKRANFKANKTLITLNDLQNEGEKIFFYKNFINSLTNGYKISNGIITCAVQNNFELYGACFDINRFDFSSYTLADKMSGGSPITIDDYYYVKKLYDNPSYEKIKKIMGR